MAIPLLNEMLKNFHSSVHPSPNLIIGSTCLIEVETLIRGNENLTT